LGNLLRREQQGGFSSFGNAGRRDLLKIQGWRRNLLCAHAVDGEKQKEMGESHD
jgi:hypothetical protein